MTLQVDTTEFAADAFLAQSKADGGGLFALAFSILKLAQALRDVHAPKREGVPAEPDRTIPYGPT